MLEELAPLAGGGHALDDDISDRKVARALVDHLRQRMSAPERVKKFVKALQRKFEELEAKSDDPRASSTRRSTASARPSTA